ncbi:MAG: UDP-N-acetylmuramate:L-alanyl-gamma-D-glutamyl-meso-diaminopimelate ligase [Desulfobacterales bacterium]|nr:UDP-N-acetylmuramate:L-alanyl-gamma-D-glutamyl-meso-diaminopimelate ligase [Desulfobacterales bacterium]
MSTNIDIDMQKNSIPNDVKHIHLIAICGTAMAALACMLKAYGYHVTGSDQKVYPPMSDFLIQQGITLQDGFHEDNLKNRPDLVVIGNAVFKTNPEVVMMNQLGLHFCSMPQALNHFIAKQKQTILITGTHGKTTTTALMAWVLDVANLDPSLMVGGIANNFNSNYRLGKGNYMVIEGDEYDTAFFDKAAKFFHYKPAITLLTSIEFDHADIYKDIDHIKDTFAKLIQGLSSDSLLISYEADSNITELRSKASCMVHGYGTTSDAIWQLTEIQFQPPWSLFSILKDGNHFGTFRTRMMGEHNLLNATAVIAASHALQIPNQVMATALETFKGVKRRQEVRGEKNGITVMDDFAHHPTAVRETIKAVKPFYSKGRVIAVFEPRTNTSMRDVFQHSYPDAFLQADMVCIRKPPLLEKIPSTMRFSSEQLVMDIRQQGKDAHFFEDTDQIIHFVCKEARPGDLILIMSNGGFDHIHDRLLAAL